jgi:S-adenosylmethionine synthetase
MVNAADDIGRGSLYLTVTGTSAEAGDDGEAGRGNRVNGLIAPHRPMTMESVAGKNPVTHVGKLYNVAAQSIAGSIVKEIPGVSAAECYLVSRIGQPIREPQLAEVRIFDSQARPPSDFGPMIAAIVSDHLSHLNSAWRRFVDGDLASLF